MLDLTEKIRKFTHKDNILEYFEFNNKLKYDYFTIQIKGKEEFFYFPFWNDFEDTGLVQPNYISKNYLMRDPFVINPISELTEEYLFDLSKEKYYYSETYLFNINLSDSYWFLDQNSKSVKVSCGLKICQDKLGNDFNYDAVEYGKINFKKIQHHFDYKDQMEKELKERKTRDSIQYLNKENQLLYYSRDGFSQDTVYSLEILEYNDEFLRIRIMTNDSMIIKDEKLIKDKNCDESVWSIIVNSWGQCYNSYSSNSNTWDIEQIYLKENLHVIFLQFIDDSKIHYDDSSIIQKDGIMFQ